MSHKTHLTLPIYYLLKLNLLCCKLSIKLFYHFLFCKILLRLKLKDEFLSICRFTNTFNFLLYFIVESNAIYYFAC